MTKDEMIGEIVKYNTPIQGRLLRNYSHQRLEDYLNYLRLTNPKQKADSQVPTAKLQRAGTK